MASAEAGLESLVGKTKDILRPYGQTETLLYYGLVATKLRKFLAGKLIAAKNWIPKGPMPSLIKRGSREPPLSIDEIIEAVTPDFLQVRSTIEHLDAAKPKLTPAQQKVWSYFLPRKLNDFFYATNGESPGKPLDRIFFDLDRGEKLPHAKAQEAAKAFVEAIHDDSKFWSEAGKFTDKEIMVDWTGSSFHVLLFFTKPQPNDVYLRLFQYSKSDPLKNYTGRWAEAVGKATGLRVIGGHEKAEGAIVIDPSQTPSGKLCRAPLGSLHMSDAKTVDGVSVPLKEEMLGNRKLVAELTALRPGELIENLDSWAKNLPKRFQ